MIERVVVHSYYFGVGGGIRDFQKRIEESVALICTVEKSFDNGCSNIRDVLHVQWRHGFHPTDCILKRS
jgi:hypothetical protein